MLLTAYAELLLSFLQTKSARTKIKSTLTAQQACAITENAVVGSRNRLRRFDDIIEAYKSKWQAVLGPATRGGGRGHVTLWNGNQCSDTCHLLADPDNGPFIPDTGAIWVLP